MHSSRWWLALVLLFIAGALGWLLGRGALAAQDQPQLRGRISVSAATAGEVLLNGDPVPEEDLQLLAERFLTARHELPGDLPCELRHAVLHRAALLHAAWQPVTGNDRAW